MPKNRSKQVNGGQTATRPACTGQPTHCAYCGSAFPVYQDGRTGAAGYGITPEGEHICYACCAQNDLTDMCEHGNTSLYLTIQDGNRVVSNWPGSLVFRSWGYRESWHNFAGRNGRRDAWFHGPDGHVWHAVSIGNMDLCRCKRTKELSRRAS